MKLDKHDPITKEDPNDVDLFGPRPPPGYTALRAAPSQILLPLTVSNKCGQAFRWRGNKVWEPLNQGFSNQTYDEQIEWSLCLSDRVVLLRQDQHRGFLYHKTLLPSTAESPAMETAAVNIETERWLNDYLNLDVPLEALYAEWQAKDPVFARFATRFTGLRMLRQDPWECLCAFVCSSNNNIARIGQMVQNLCTHFSEPLCEYVYHPPPDNLTANHEDVEGEMEEKEQVKQGEVRIVYHPFPPPEALAKPGVEEKLRELGFGYRAKYLAKTAQMLCDKHSHPPSNRGGHTVKKLEHLDESHWLYGIKSENDGMLALAQQSIPASPASKVEELVEEQTPVRKRARSSRNSSTSSSLTTSTAPTSTTDITCAAEEPTFKSVRSYLQHLRTTSYHHARSELMQFPGVGPKVADCILLMSLDQSCSIPVDRHVFQLAEKWYKLRTKKYEEIADYFRNLWGEYAGWAHSVLFTADLRSFANYGASKKEEKIEAGSGDDGFWAEGKEGYPTSPASQGAMVKEEELQAVHSPPRVGIPELVPQSLSGVEAGVKVQGDAAATLAERIKIRPKRKIRLIS